MDQLPTDIHLIIFDYLEPKDFDKYMLFNLKFKQCYSDFDLFKNYILKHHPRFLYRVNEGLEWATKHNNRKLMSFFREMGAIDPAYQLFGAIKSGCLNLVSESLVQIKQIYNNIEEIQDGTAYHISNNIRTLNYHPYKKKSRYENIYNVALHIALKCYQKNKLVYQKILQQLVNVINSYDNWSFGYQILKHCDLESLQYLETILPEFLHNLLVPELDDDVIWHYIGDHIKSLIERGNWQLFYYCINSVYPETIVASDWITAIRLLPQLPLQVRALCGLVKRGSLTELYQLLPLINDNIDYIDIIEDVINSFVVSGHHRSVKELLSHCSVKPYNHWYQCDQVHLGYQKDFITLAEILATGYNDYEALLVASFKYKTINEISHLMDLFFDKATPDTKVKRLIVACLDYDRPDIVKLIKSHCIQRGIKINIDKIKEYYQ